MECEFTAFRNSFCMKDTKNPERALRGLDRWKTVARELLRLADLDFERADAVDPAFHPIAGD